MKTSATANKRTVIWLGAGASAADGAPLQGDLFRTYFSHQVLKSRRRPWDTELKQFFTSFFGINLRSDRLPTTLFPTFEEVLGVLELAHTERECFRGWPTSFIQHGKTKQYSSSLRDILVFLIAETLDVTLSKSPEHHKKLVRGMRPRLATTTFVSLNYDILIDNALADLGNEWDLDYGIDFANFGEGVWDPPDPKRSVALLKLHGSLNWLFCPTCRTISLTPREKGVVKLITSPDRCVCPDCNTLQTPVIVPPTYFKSVSNPYLRKVWHLAEEALVRADRLVFSGYSFPDADLNIRYLLKRVELRRRSPLEVLVFNEYSDKPQVMIDAERDRFKRFLICARNNLKWERAGFEELAADPVAAIES